MDKITKYRGIAKVISDEVMSKLSSSTEFDSLPIIDDVHGQYLIMSDGWEGIERSYGPIIHIEVKESGKVWLRCDGTDLEIGQELLDRGVLKSDLILGFYSPKMREYGGFAVA